MQSDYIWARDGGKESQETTMGSDLLRKDQLEACGHRSRLVCYYLCLWI